LTNRSISADISVVNIPLRRA